MFEPIKEPSRQGLGSYGNHQANDLRSLTESDQTASVITIEALDRGYKFKLLGSTEVELQTGNENGPVVALHRCRIGQRVIHLGRVHRVVCISSNGIVRRLIHQSQGRVL